jgi:hypothetical protein
MKVSLNMCLRRGEATVNKKWIAGLAAVLGIFGTVQAQTIDPFYSTNYSYTDLGSVPELPSNYGGLTFKFDDPNKIIIGGAANTANGNFYTIDVVRDGNGHVTGFSGIAQFYATGEYNDGGVAYGPNNVLFASRWPVNGLGQYLPGSTAPDKVIDLGAMGVASSNASVAIVPAGFAGAGRIKLGSWSGGEFYDGTITPDGSGTYDLVGITQMTTLPGGPEGFVYVPLGSALFANPSMIVSEYSAGAISTFELDANGDPIVGTRRTFMTGLTGAEGAVIDPVTGDFLFSTFGGGNRVIVVTGFAVPEPGTFFALGAGLVLLVGLRRRK